MGVRGLFTYIQTYADSALEWHMLHDCKLIIDGSNLAHDIYNNTTGINAAYGGDYDKYANGVEDFLKKLIQCRVEPYIIMDGGHPLFKRKFKTVCDRMTQQISSCLRVNPSNQAHMKIFPIMARSVFVNVAQKLGVSVLQSDFEADDEIVVLAKSLDAYVLSNDSDFFLFDVKFIVLNSLNFKNIQKEKKENGVSIKYIPCYRFNPEIFTQITKVPKVLFPLLAPTLGNDFVFPSAMVKFYDHISELRPSNCKISERHQVIISVIKWLANQPQDPDAVLKKILEILSHSCEDRRVKDLKFALESYYPSHSSLSCWITPHGSKCQSSKGKSLSYTSGSLSKIDFQKEIFIPLRVKKELECTCNDRLETQMTHGAQLPDWFIRAYRLHLLPPIIANILNKKYFFIVPQIELPSRKSIYLVFEPMIRIVRGILWLTLSRSLEMKKLNLEKPFSNKSVKVGSVKMKSGFFKHLLDKKTANKNLKYSDWESESEEESESVCKPKIDGNNDNTGDCKVGFEIKLKEVDSDVNKDEVNKGDDETEDDNDENVVNSKDDENMEVDSCVDEDEVDCSINNDEVECDAEAEDDIDYDDAGADDVDCDDAGADDVACDDAGADDDVDCDDAGADDDEVEKEANSEKDNENKVAKFSHRERRGKRILLDDVKEEVNYDEFSRNKKIPCVKWYIRKYSGLCGREFPLEDISAFKIYPNLYEMDKLTVREKRLAFYRIANLHIEFEEALPPNLEFILFCICFWHTKYESKHIHQSCFLAVLMSTIMFCVVDGKCGRKRSIKSFENASMDSKKVKSMINSENFADPANMSISELILSLTKEECQLANLDLYQFHYKSPADGKKSYNVLAVHAFSEYQATVYFLQLLNSIVCFPYPNINIESFWSGTFCYNMQKCFASDLELSIILASLFNNNVRIIHLFTRLYSILQKHLSIPVYKEVVLNVSKEKKDLILSRKRKKLGIRTACQLGISTKRRKKNNSKKSDLESVPTKEFDVIENPTTEDLEMLAGNRFSSLLIGSEF